MSSLCKIPIRVPKEKLKKCLRRCIVLSKIITQLFRFLQILDERDPHLSILSVPLLRSFQYVDPSVSQIRVQNHDLNKCGRRNIIPSLAKESDFKAILSCRFWTNLIHSSSADLQDPVVSLKDLQLRFVRDRKVPAGLTTVLNTMLRSAKRSRAQLRHNSTVGDFVAVVVVSRLVFLKTSPQPRWYRNMARFCLQQIEEQR